MRAQRFQLRHVDLFDIGEMRDAALGFLHLLGDLAAQADHLDLVDAVALGVGAVRRRHCTAAARNHIGSRSAWLMRPAGPVPGTNCSLMPSSSARARTAGEASGLVPGTRATTAERVSAFAATALACGSSAFDGSRLRRGRRSGLRGRGLFGRLGRMSVGLHVASAFDFEFDQRRADGGHVAGTAVERHDDARNRRRHLDRRLVRHHVDEVLVFVHVIADGDMPGDDFGFGGAFADIGKLEDVTAHLSPPSARCMASATRAGPGKYCHSKACG